MQRHGRRGALHPELPGERCGFLVIGYLRLKVRVKVPDRSIFSSLSQRHGLAERGNLRRRRAGRRRNHRVDMPAGVNLRLDGHRDHFAGMRGHGASRRHKMHRQRPRLSIPHCQQQKKRRQKASPKRIHHFIHSIYYKRPAAIVPQHRARQQKKRRPLGPTLSSTLLRLSPSILATYYYYGIPVAFAQGHDEYQTDAYNLIFQVCKLRSQSNMHLSIYYFCQNHFGNVSFLSRKIGSLQKIQRFPVTFRHLPSSR